MPLDQAASCNVTTSCSKHFLRLAPAVAKVGKKGLVFFRFEMVLFHFGSSKMKKSDFFRFGDFSLWDGFLLWNGFFHFGTVFFSLNGFFSF